MPSSLSVPTTPTSVASSAMAADSSVPKSTVMSKSASAVDAYSIVVTSSSAASTSPTALLVIVPV